MYTYMYIYIYIHIVCLPEAARDPPLELADELSSAT